MAEATRTLIFTYGTLKQGHQNHFLMQDLILKKESVFLGAHMTHQPHPLVIGPHGIPYLINLPGYGHRVKGELYSVSTQGLVRLDELEGISIGHYERLPIQVYEEENDGVSVAAEAYFAHTSFGEKLWERKGKVGLNQFGEKEGKEYVRKDDRPQGFLGIMFIVWGGTARAGRGEFANDVDLVREIEALSDFAKVLKAKGVATMKMMDDRFEEKAKERKKQKLKDASK